MTEHEAQRWLADQLDVPRETIVGLAALVAAVMSEISEQNLVAASTLPHIWERHVVDSAQLLRFAPQTGSWIDIGSGAGFPGLVIAIVGKHMVKLVESRARRAAFLRDTVAMLNLYTAEVISSRVEQVSLPPAAVLSARAVAPLGRLFAAGCHLADENTVWLLPKGRNAASELEAARESWQGEFIMHPSVTDPEAAIIVARNVTPRMRP